MEALLNWITESPAIIFVLVCCLVLVALMGLKGSSSTEPQSTHVITGNLGEHTRTYRETLTQPLDTYQRTSMGLSEMQNLNFYTFPTQPRTSFSPYTTPYPISLEREVREAGIRRDLSEQVQRDWQWHQRALNESRNYRYNTISTWGTDADRHWVVRTDLPRTQSKPIYDDYEEFIL